MTPSQASQIRDAIGDRIEALTILGGTPEPRPPLSGPPAGFRSEKPLMRHWGSPSSGVPATSATHNPSTEDVVEDELSVHAHLQFTTVPFKLPRPHSSVRCKTQVNARVRDEVQRCLGRRMLREIGRCADPQFLLDFLNCCTQNVTESPASEGKWSRPRSRPGAKFAVRQMTRAYLYLESVGWRRWVRRAEGIPRTFTKLPGPSGDECCSPAQ